MKKLFLVFLTSLLVFQCKKTPIIEVGQTVFISATTLNARKTPTIDGEKLGKVRLGDVVRVLERSETEMEIDGIKSFWYRVESPFVTGWVFGGYLSITKVETRDAIIGALQGNFVYCRLPDRLDCSNTFEFKGERFVYRGYDQYSGITEKLEGNYDVQSGRLVLDPKERLIRPSIFIVYPQNEEESTAYNNAYFGYTTSEQYLVSLSTYPAEGKKDLYFFMCNEKLLLSEAKQDPEEACKSSYAYSKSTL
ncbi:SH3 domain-containing protein [Leptospira sp. WS39.C2]